MDEWVENDVLNYDFQCEWEGWLVGEEWDAQNQLGPFEPFQILKAKQAIPGIFKEVWGDAQAAQIVIETSWEHC